MFKISNAVKPKALVCAVSRRAWQKYKQPGETGSTGQK